MKKILIIGGSGILSSAVVNACILKGYDVTIMNRGNNVTFTNNLAKIIICDVQDELQVKLKIRNLHFAVIIDFIVYNLEQLKRSLSLFGDIAEQYVFISSAQVYNTSIQKVHRETDETPQKLWSYSVNKDICEKYLRAYCREHGIIYTIVRPGVNYDNRRIPYGMYPPIGMHYTIVSRILVGKPIIIWNNGENKLNLTRVEDFACGIVGLLGNQKAYNECFNVVGDNVYSWKQVLDMLGKILGVQVRTINLPLSLYANELDEDDREMLLGGRAYDLVCSNEKLKCAVPDFCTKITLYEGLKMVLDWYKCNDYYFGFDYRWDAQQDRIIAKIGKRNVKIGYTNYSRCTFVESLTQRCVYEIEYNKDKKMDVLMWKCIRKFISKPLKKLYQR